MTGHRTLSQTRLERPAGLSGGADTRDCESADQGAKAGTLGNVAWKQAVGGIDAGREARI